MSAQHYVVGLAFNAVGSAVVLMRKNRPVWQAGKLNGVGGQVEAGEAALDAMVREFVEETGVQIPSDAWTHFAVLQDDKAMVDIFHSFDDAALGVRSNTDEEILIFSVRDECIARDGVGDLALLTRTALDRSHQGILRLGTSREAPCR